MRIGFGQYDLCFKKDSSFYLGGILFSTDDKNSPNDFNDILIHGIADSLLGAACLGGLYNYKDKNKINDPDILREIEREIHYLGWVIENIDVTITVPDQRIVGKRTKILSTLISSLYLKPDQLNIKFVFNSHDENTKDYKIHITAITLLTKRS
ncbi:MAG: 2-C-methyl-D-erythritol 2,4-cyclodiphosphate synthase [Calditrichaceae bacterium]